MPAILGRISTLICPACAFRETLTMPEDACVIRHACASCGAEIQAKPGDCCVFCSYGDVACPPKQRGGACCAPSPGSCA
jgi:hypothetical protein